MVAMGATRRKPMKHLEIKVKGWTYRIIPKEYDSLGNMWFGVYEYREQLDTWVFVYGLFAPSAGRRSAYISVFDYPKDFPHGAALNRHARVMRYLRKKLPWRSLQLIFSV